MKACRILVCLFVFPLLLLSAPLPRTYVSSTGLDSNSCTFSSPCLTFAGAYPKTQVGGEIDVLGSGEFGSLLINHAVTIDGGSNIAAIIATVSLTSTLCQSAICVFADSSETVTLRNLSITVPGAPGATGGIVFGAGGYLRVENVSIGGAASQAITLSTGTTTLDHVRVQNAGVAVSASALVSINNSSMSGNGTAVASLAPAVVNIDNTLMQYNGQAVSVSTGGTVRLSNTTITDNATGLANGGGTIVSYVNNRIYGNTTNGAPTVNVYQK